MVLLPTTENLCPLELIQLYFVSGSRGFRMQKGSDLYQPVFINDLMYPGVGEDSSESYGLQVHSKGDQSWVFFGRNDAKAETPVL